MTTLRVYRERDPIGNLWLDSEGSFVFQYGPEWLQHPGNFPLSLSLPLQEAPFERGHPKLFFSNLLPEGDVRRLIAAKLGISPENDFKLLEAIGGDCAGALTLLPEGASPLESGNYRLLPTDELDRIIESMPRRPLLAAEEGVRLSLAGAQNKLPVHYEDEKLYLPEGSFASSYILKPQIPHIEDAVFNEAFCMMLAGRLGFSVARPLAKSTGKNWYYLVERYDRVVRPGERVRRLHQEDFCQALGRKPELKYENEGGPAFRDCFRLLEASSNQPAADKKSLILWTIFNYLIGNADAHGKNVSLLISENGIRLAPFYDLMSTMVYPDLSQKMAMRVGGKYEHDRVFRRHWERFAGEAGVKPDFVLQMLRETTLDLPQQADALLAHLPQLFQQCDIISRIRAMIRRHCTHVEKYVLAPSET